MLNIINDAAPHPFSKAETKLLPAIALTNEIAFNIPNIISQI